MGESDSCVVKNTQKTFNVRYEKLEKFSGRKWQFNKLNKSQANAAANHNKALAKEKAGLENRRRQAEAAAKKKYAVPCSRCNGEKCGQCKPTVLGFKDWEMYVNTHKMKVRNDECETCAGLKERPLLSKTDDESYKRVGSTPEGTKFVVCDKCCGSGTREVTMTERAYAAYKEKEKEDMKRVLINALRGGQKPPKRKPKRADAIILPKTDKELIEELAMGLAMGDINPIPLGMNINAHIKPKRGTMSAKK